MRMLKYATREQCICRLLRHFRNMPGSNWHNRASFFAKTFFLLSLFVVISSNAQTSSETPNDVNSVKLEQAFELRSANPSRSKSLLDQISRESLGSLEQDKYDYLQAYSSFISGDIEAAISAFKQLVKYAQTEEYRQTSEASLLSLYSATQNWVEALAMFENVLPYTRTENTSSSRENALIAVINFYNQVDELDVQAAFIEPLLDEDLSIRFKCHAYFEWFNAKVELDASSLTKQRFDAALKQCEPLNEPIIKYALLENYARFYFYTGKTEQALSIINSHLTDAVAVGYITLTQEFYDLLGLIYFEQKQFSQAKEFATKAVELEVLDVATSSNISAHQTLFKVAEREENFEVALQHFKTYTALNSRKIDTVNAKLLAVQKAKHDSEQKSNQIALLDKENALLKANAMLAEKGNLNRNLMIVIVFLLCIGLIIWLIREHKNYLTMRELSQKDDLTGLANSRYFRSHGSMMLKHAKVRRKTMSFIVFDLDDFKKINDEYGHRIGDFALKSAAKAAESRCRANDFIGRLGGEEFGIILDGCNISQARQVAESCRQEIEKILQHDSLSFKVTASFGIADSTTSNYSFDALFNSADQAMYNAKRNGKNRVKCA